MKTLLQYKLIICLDLGAGNVSVRYFEPTGGAVTDELTVVSSFIKNPRGSIDFEPAGLLDAEVDKERSIFIGKEMWTIDITRFSKVYKFETTIKAKPSECDKVLFSQYAKTWLRAIAKDVEGWVNLLDPNEEVMWVIGCPTGWDAEARAAYADMFREAGYQNPVISKESNAAMCQLITESRVISGKLDKEYAVLCLDLGAYSNDATLVYEDENGERKVQSYGGYCGASILDRCIVEMNLRNQERYNDWNIPFNPEGVIEDLIEQRDKNPVLYDFLNIQGRRLKEKYFDAIDVAHEFTYKRDERGRRCRCKFVCNDALMDDLTMHKSVREILGENVFGLLKEEVKQEVGDNTIYQCYKNFFMNAKQQFADNLTPAMLAGKLLILLTGGASKMSFIRSIVAKVFEAEEQDENVILSDQSPCSTIVEGITKHAPARVRYAKLKSSYDLLVNHPDFKKWVTPDVEKMVRQTLVDMDQNLGNDIFMQCISDYCQFNIDGFSIAPKAVQRIRDASAAKRETWIKSWMSTFNEDIRARLKAAIRDNEDISDDEFISLVDNLPMMGRICCEQQYEINLKWWEVHGELMHSYFRRLPNPAHDPGFFFNNDTERFEAYDDLLNTYRSEIEQGRLRNQEIFESKMEAAAESGEDIAGIAIKELKKALHDACETALSSLLVDED